MNFSADIDTLLSTSRDNGAEFWATPDGSLIKGGPFSTLEAAYILSELGLEASHPATAKSASSLLWQAQRADGRFSLVPEKQHIPLPYDSRGKDALRAWVLRRIAACRRR